MLRIIHQLINVQGFNTYNIRELSKNFTWEKIGISINPSLALINHSCDPNTIRCNLDKNTILVAGQHIQRGEEITDSYHVHFKNSDYTQRQYHTLKHYMFECECPACLKKWPLEDEIPDFLPRVPNWEHEKFFKKKTGDKKDIVDGIIEARKVVEKLMSENDYVETLIAYGPLCELIEEHVTKPHIYYLQARAGISHCLWNLYCQQKSKNDELEENEDITGRDHAVKIYQSDFMEKTTEKKSFKMINGEAVWPVKNQPESAEDVEKKKILEATKQAILNSTANLGAVKSDHLAMKDTIKAMKDLASEHLSMDKVVDINHIITDAEFAELVKQKEQEAIAIKEELAKFQEELTAVEIQVSERHQKEREELEKKREIEKKEREEEKEKLIAEKMKKYKEEEAKKKEEKLAKEIERKKKAEAAYKKKVDRENRQLEATLKKRRDEMLKEEEELEQLLALAMEDENPKPKENMQEESIAPNSNIDDFITNKSESTSQGMNKQSTVENTLVNGNFNATKTEDDSNSVWAALRELRESAIGKLDFSIERKQPEEKDEKMEEDSFDLFIKEIRAKAELAKKASKEKEMNNSNILQESKAANTKLSVVNESNELDVNNIETNTDNVMIEKEVEDKENIESAVPFDYNAWSKNIEKFYKEENDAEIRALAEDQAYLTSLKQVINERIEKDVIKKKKQNANSKPTVKPAPKPKIVVSEQDEMKNLKHKEKERKRKKREDKFKENEDKMRDVAIKTAKIDKIVKGADEEIIRMRELSNKLLKKSKQMDQEVVDLNLDDIRPSNEDRLSDCNDNVERHWTEEETNKWPNENKKNDISSALSFLKNAAMDKLDTEKLKTSIDAVKEAKPEPKKPQTVPKETTDIIKKSNLTIDSSKDKQIKPVRSNAENSKNEIPAVSKTNIDLGQNKKLSQPLEKSKEEISTSMSTDRKASATTTNKNVINLCSDNTFEQKKQVEAYSKIEEKENKEKSQTNNKQLNNLKNHLNNQSIANSDKPLDNFKNMETSNNKEEKVTDNKSQTNNIQVNNLKKNSDKQSKTNSDKPLDKKKNMEASDKKEKTVTNDKPQTNAIKQISDNPSIVNSDNPPDKKKTMEASNKNKVKTSNEQPQTKAVKQISDIQSKPNSDKPLDIMKNTEVSNKKEEKLTSEKPQTNDNKLNSLEKLSDNQTKTKTEVIPKSIMKVPKASRETISNAEPSTKSKVKDVTQGNSNALLSDHNSLKQENTEDGKKNYAIRKVATEKILLPPPKDTNATKDINVPKDNIKNPIKENYAITKEPTQNIVIVKKFAPKVNQSNAIQNKELPIDISAVNSTRDEICNAQAINSTIQNRKSTTKESKKVEGTTTQSKPRQEEIKVDLNKNNPNGRPVTKIKFTGNSQENVENSVEKDSHAELNMKPTDSLKNGGESNKSQVNKKESNQIESSNGTDHNTPSLRIDQSASMQSSPKAKPSLAFNGSSHKYPSTEKKQDFSKPPMSPRIEKKLNAPAPNVEERSSIPVIQKTQVSPTVEKKLSSPALPKSSMSPKVEKKLSSPAAIKSTKIDTAVEPQPLKVPDSPKAGGVFLVTPFSFTPAPNQSTSSTRRPPPPKMKPPPPPPMF